jgi:hypothetical protein
MANPIKFFTDISLNRNQLKSAAIETATANPSTPVTGQIYYNTSGSGTSNKRLHVYDGTSFVSIPYAGSIINADITNSTIQIGKIDTSSASGSGGVRLNNIGLPDASVSFNNQKITNLASPQTGDASSTAATKGYVDAAVSGLNVHAPANVATTTDLGGTYNSTSKTLTVTSFGGTIDGYSIVNTDRVLVKDQSTTGQNGIYTASISGSTLTLTRASDYNNDTSGEIAPGDYVLVLSGGQKGNSYTMSNTSFTTLDAVGATGAITFTQFGQVTNYTAGNGLSLNSSNQFSINTSVTVDLNTGQTLTNKTFTDNVTSFQNSSTNSKKMKFDLGSVSASTTRTLTVPDNDGTIALTTSNVSSATTATNIASGAAGSLPYQTGSGATSFVAIGTSSYILSSSGTAPQWISTSTARSNLASGSGNALASKFAGPVTNDTAGARTITHNLNTTDVTVQVYETSSGTATNLVYTDVAVTGVNTITVTFATQDSAVYRVVVTG